MTDRPDPGIVERFKALGELPENGVPVASLSLLWWVGEDGSEKFSMQFDGVQRVSTTVGDLTLLIHELIHANRENQ